MVELRVIEVIQSHRLIVRVCEVVNPAEGVRINVDDLVAHKTLAVLVIAARTAGEKSAIVITLLVHFLVRGTVFLVIFGINIVTVVAPPVFIVQHADIEHHWRIVIKPRISHKEQRAECSTYFLIFGIPVNILFPVDDSGFYKFPFVFTGFVLHIMSAMLFSILNLGIAQKDMCNRVANPIDKLAILVVGNLGLVHIEGGYGDIP